jgi:hypothetical protein
LIIKRVVVSLFAGDAAEAFASGAALDVYEWEGSLVFCS